MDQLKIKTIEITNFRSIRKLQCDLSDISVFVGQNDVGKSNILKALNLFFNGEVEPGRELLFNEDYNFAGHRHKKADEIGIKVTFSLPQSYHRNNGEHLIYEKRWRDSGEVPSEWIRDAYYGLRANGERVDISSRSNVNQLISRINFIYVPAIRGMNYFDSLRLRIYQTLTRVAHVSLSQASSTFESKIRKYMLNLLTETRHVLSENVRLSFPEDLSKIFEKLDFLFGKDKISINRRGDGIKGQYVPVILNFISVSERQLRGKGVVPHTFIWGYEEPENNTEIRKCIEMRDQFIEYVQNSVSQILITTHSPVYYNIKECELDDSKFKILHITKDKGKGTCAADASGRLDEELGTVAMMSDVYKKLEADLKRSEKEKTELRKILAAKQRPCLFVEGPTDARVIGRLLSVFGIERNFSIVDNGSNGGANFVLDMLRAWETEKKFKETRYPAAGLVDEDAMDKVREFDARKHPHEFVRRFVLKGSNEVRMWKQKNKFLLTEYLEIFYPESVWDAARERGWLVEKKRSEIFNARTQRTYIDGEKTEADLLQGVPLYITHKILRYRKVEMSELVCSLEDKELREAFADLQPMLEEIAEFLNCKHANNEQI